MQLTLWTYEGPPHVGAMRIAPASLASSYAPAQCRFPPPSTAASALSASIRPSQYIIVEISSPISSTLSPSTRTLPAMVLQPTLALSWPSAMAREPPDTSYVLPL